MYQIEIVIEDKDIAETLGKVSLIACPSLRDPDVPSAGRPSEAPWESRGILTCINHSVFSGRQISDYNALSPA